MSHLDRFGQVAVLMGGTSSERAVSLESGQAVYKALEAIGMDVIAIDITDDVSCLQGWAFDRAFIALHGRNGEDGCIQGLLESYGIPYTGSGVMSSALAMDKARSKWLWQTVGVPTLPFVMIENHQVIYGSMDEITYPCAVKPVLEGSSVGISRVEEPKKLADALEYAYQSCGTVIIEPWVSGGEYTVGLLGDTGLPSIKIETSRLFYDYQAKYEDDETRFLCPSGLPQEFEEHLLAIAWKAFRSLGCQGWGRVDFVLDGEHKPWVLEVNTIPGLTSHSLVPTAANKLGLSFTDLVLKILETSFTSHQDLVAPHAAPLTKLVRQEQAKSDPI